MCRFCGVKLKEANQCNNNREEYTLDTIDGSFISCCNLCKDKQEEKYRNPDALSEVATSVVSPSVSISSGESLVSTCSDSCDYSVDMNAYYRSNEDEDVMNGNHENHNFSGSDRPGTVIGIEENSVADIDHDAIDMEKINNNEAQEQGIGALECFDGSYIVENIGSNSSYSLGIELDALLWEPPEPEDFDDDAECSAGSFDNDDDDDGMKWGNPVSLGRFGEEGGGRFSFKSEKQRAMLEVMNGRFKPLVAQLLHSVGVSLTGEANKSWIDVVSSLTWEAASFVKADAAEGKAMDPDGYVKVKCIASGSVIESQLIKGLVFKKHAAHKHMPTKYINPNLLLIRGMLGQSLGGLSSFDLMDQERNSVNSIIEMIEICHPNVILVERSVSRDVQEYILKKGMTLVIDMKLHRLERVARCTASPILSPETFKGKKLKQCDVFHFEKFIEEHTSLEGGKRPSKTLMFIEGCPTRLGCTILLKGSHSDELKKIKCVVQCAFVMAYHLILETSFLSDQRAMFSTVPFVGMRSILPNGDESSFVDPRTSTASCLEAFTSKQASSSKPDIPISGTKIDSNSVLFCEPYNPDALDGLSLVQASLKKVIGDNFPHSSSSYRSLSSFFGLDGSKEAGHISPHAPPFIFSESCCHNIDEAKLIESERVSSSSLNSCEAPQDAINEDQTESKDDIGMVLDSQSILVLMSSRNASKGIICEQIHFSHIKFYKNFDVPLGKFLHDNLLNQKHQCKLCGEPPDAHFYYYAHHKKELTIQVKLHPPEKCLSGGKEGKLWMWSCCGKCKPGNGSTKSTKRVLISSITRRLSFGKFLEMSFSLGQTSFKQPSCGHSLDGDFLYFFGSGSMVAMFRYSPVVTFSVSMPPQKLELSSNIRCMWLDKEIEHVHKKGINLFMELESSLQKIRHQFEGCILYCEGPKEFCDIEGMLSQEKTEFEERIQVVKSGNSNMPVLNRLIWELLLECCVWDRRFYLLSSGSIMVENVSSDRGIGQNHLQGNGASIVNDEIKSENSSDESKLSQKEIPSEKILQDSGRQDEASSISNNVQGVSGGLGTDGMVQLKKNSCICLNSSQRGSLSLLLSNIESWKGYVWCPFHEIRHDCTKDIQNGFMPKFEPLGSIHNTKLLPSAHQLIREEGSKLHIYLSSDDLVLVDLEDELSSIIACALALLMNSPIEEDTQKEQVTESSHITPDMDSLDSSHSSNDSLGSDGTHSASTISLEESHFSSFDGLNLLNSLVSFGACHPEVSLGLGKLPGKCKYSVVCFYSNEFRNLRNRWCPSELDYIASLSRCKRWDAKGGKSKSVFAKTLDGRFIIKEIKKTEFESFMKFALAYFEYMTRSVEAGNQTCLAKIMGLYQVRVMTSGKEVKHEVMVMENVTFGRNVSRQYDLKGALHARFNSAVAVGNDVLLDQNFVNDMIVSPLYVSNNAKKILQRAVWNDTTFLNSINVMDYSLIVGVDTQRRELVCGIIDYVRQYTWDKALETWVKSSLVVPRNARPTIISPQEYKKRFRKFMSTHFLSVPDHWCTSHTPSL